MKHTTVRSVPTAKGNRGGGAQVLEDAVIMIVVDGEPARIVGDAMRLESWRSSTSRPILTPGAVVPNVRT